MPPPWRLAVCAFWAAAIPVQLVVARLAREAGLPKTVVRKLFHAFAVVMFAPVIATDAGFVAVAGAGALRLLVLLEVARSGNVPLLGEAVGRWVSPFVDARDGGALVLTHVLLLAGCMLPVWMSPLARGRVEDGWFARSLLPQSGILSVGVVDAAAAVVGSELGRWEWAAARPKTVEGSLAGAVAGTTFACLLWAWGGEAAWQLCGCAGIAALVSLHETFTGVIDNAATPAYAVGVVAAVAVIGM